MAWILDLDGVVWLGHRPIDGSVETVARLRRSGHEVVFVTNNSSAPVAAVEEALDAIGIPALGAVVTSAQAAARLVAAGCRAHVLGGPGIVEALEAQGVELVDGVALDAGAPPVDAVVVGLTRTFDYDGLRVAASAVRAGAVLIGTNDDVTYPSPNGLVPGGGALLAAVAAAAEVDAIVAGKPHGPMVDLVLERVGAGPHVVVGDRASTDGALARALGARFGLVLSGVTDRPPPPTPDGDALADLVADDLASLVDRAADAGWVDADPGR